MPDSSEREPKSKPDEQMTIIKLQLIQQIFIYSNFFFFKELLAFGTRLIDDMNQKQRMLIDSASQDSAVKKHIKDGFKLVGRIQEFAQD